MACSIVAEKFALVISTAITLIVALVIGLTWRTISINYMLTPQLVLQNNTQNYDYWKESPVPIYLEVYFFNWTNHEDVHNRSIKPHFTEMGPYVFSEKHIRTNIVWNDNGTVTFNQIRIWHFDETQSNGSLTDEVTNLNVIAATVGYSARYFNNALKFLIRTMMGSGRAPLVVTKTVKELLFDGYEDPLLTLVRANGNPDLPKPPFDKFGWFVDRNESETYDGNFTMFTGVDQIENLGVLELWNDQNTTGLYRDECDEVSGTTGELWPPNWNRNKLPITLFATDVCRSITLNYESDITVRGVPGFKWIGDESVFDNGIKYPSMACYCSAAKESCPDLLTGLFNASSCKFGAPAFVSFPHFYLAHENYRDEIEGMHPNKDRHEFSIALEPRTGIPLQIQARLQINLMMKSYPWAPDLVGVPNLMMPMFWFQQVAELSPELASDARLAAMLPDIGLWIAYGLAGLGGVLILVSILCFVYRWRRRSDDYDDEILDGNVNQTLTDN
ncbi:CLUMA_CG007355, isoform A [Clunio marinus]|uniref:CLUMA_CG007355, isoform A n=1 Tax=Clunio marinus TaxID=568069 RepID=A0A1J1I2L1_9DIPT|nr:CLUMA_CG007355, isoform A [Clunio marinus]